MKISFLNKFGGIISYITTARAHCQPGFPQHLKEACWQRIFQGIVKKTCIKNNSILLNRRHSSEGSEARDILKVNFGKEIQS